MKRETFKSLNSSDIVRMNDDDTIYIVHANYGDRVTSVKVVDMTNPQEWDLIMKCHRLPGKT